MFDFQITKALGLEGPSERGMAHDFLPSYRASIADLSSETAGATTGVLNRIYVRVGTSIHPSLLQLLLLMYRSRIGQLSSPARAASEINKEVARVTHGRIPQIVTARSLDGLGMVLISALYFKDQWQKTFITRGKQNFLTPSGEKLVDMMEQKAELKHGEFSTFDVVELPFKDKAYCMLLLRPLERNMTAVRDLRSKLDSLDLRTIRATMSSKEVEVYMPRFKLEPEYSLRSSLAQLGIKKLFTSGAEWTGFDGLTMSNSDVYHKVFLEVNEKGAEAGGAMYVIRNLALPARSLVRFRLDRPFFAIVYNKKFQFNMFSAYVASP